MTGTEGASQRRRFEMKNLKSTLRRFVCWALIVWIAVALLQLNPFLGLGSALIGGILFGLALFK